MTNIYWVPSTLVQAEEKKELEEERLDPDVGVLPEVGVLPVEVGVLSSAASVVVVSVVVFPSGSK